MFKIEKNCVFYEVENNEFFLPIVVYNCALPDYGPVRFETCRVLRIIKIIEIINNFVHFVCLLCNNCRK